MRLSFASLGDRLALCCPGGRVVGLDDDPFGWLQVEQRRADEAEARADEAEARVVALEEELRRLRGEG